ncbi:MAG: single-stranded DNA-binding protein [Deltaproteobacteria bacterium]|nr:MAG: single-stranded DNA-binding protein [Deltaproteobacteria bacterium]
MVSFNRSILAGNLTRDPELKNLPSGAALCEFTLAVNRKWKDKNSGQMKEEVSFIDCVSWGKAAEVITQYVKKGNPLLVEGSLRQERWEQQDGQKRSRVRVNVENFQFLGSKKDGDSGQGSGAAAPAAEEQVPDDIPF